MNAKRPHHRCPIVHSGLAALAAAGVLLGYGDAQAGSVRLAWTAPGDDGNTGQAAAYEIRYALTAVSGTDTTSWWNSATQVGSIPPPQIAGSREAFTVTGLDSGQTYYFVLRTEDEVPNISAFSNISVRMAMGEVAFTLATPQGFQAQATRTSVTLGWNPLPADAGTECRMYRKGPSDSSPQLVQTLPITATTWTDSTVTHGATYEYRLSTYGGGLEGTPAIIQVTVPAEAPVAENKVHGYPNPAHGQVTLRFTVGTAADAAPHCRVTMFDMAGHRIRLLVDDVLSPGEHTVTWDCRSSSGDKVAPGLYNVIFESPSGRDVTQLVVLP